MYTQEELDAAIEEATAPLIKKRDELLKEVKVARKNLENVGDVEKLHERIEALETERDTLAKQAKETTKQLETVAKQLESESGFTSKLLLDNGLTDALVKAGIKKELLPAAKALFSQQAKVIADGESRKAVIGDKELSAFVTEWSASDEGKHFVAAPANGGGGADGSRNTPQGDKVVNRSTWDTMSHVERSQFATSGGKVTD
jgi:uncharacterized protein (UPF0335 family)